MHPQKRAMLWINVLGGIAVLGSYAHGFGTHPTASEALWGGVPQGIRPLYTVGMVSAAAGYFAFTYFLLRSNPERVRIDASFGFGLLNGLYIGILVPSALWMPLTFTMLAQPSTSLWYAIRIVLAVVGLASIGLLGSLIRLRPQRPAWAYWLAVVGGVAFSIQTAVLDALIWPTYFLA
jgi:hypothetical protein